MNDVELRNTLGLQAQKDAETYSIENVDPMIIGLYK